MTRTLTAAAAAFATIATFAVATPASARSVAVHYDDLNLDSVAGQARLAARIDRAAREVCDDQAGRRPLAEAAAIAACVRKARDDARARVAAIRPATRAGG